MAEQEQTLTVQKAIDLAVQHHNAGRLSQAESVYQQILQTDPNQPVALHLLGVIAHQVGKNDKAVDLITRALAIKPDYVYAHNNLGIALKALGRLDDSLASHRKALTIKPDYAEAHYNLGLALKELGKLEEAVTSYQKALALKPDYAEAHYNLGNALQELGKLEEAVASYRKALDLKPDFAEAHNNLGNALRELGKLDDALASYRKALDLKPDFAEAHNNLGNALKELGKLDDAVASHRKALAIKPDYAEVHYNLAISEKHSEYNNDIKAMEDTYAKSDLSDEEKMHLAFGLGKAHENLHQYDRAFEFFSTGNKLKRKTYDYSTCTDKRRFKNLKNAFIDTHHKKGTLAKEQTPIFIVGMPRSGTSLVEQILASHPQVHGGGELTYLSDIVTSQFGSNSDGSFANNVQKASDKDFSAAANKYLRSVRKHSRNAKSITDKMPQNFRFLGMIHHILPNAKIIHCQREPLDTCMSIFKTLFSGKGHQYAYDLTELGQYYNLYRDLMHHWRRVLPDFIYDLQYEDMVTDQEQQSRALLDYCGLKWHDACLEFYKTDRPVLTASATQVRKPIYEVSVLSWKRYESQLEPLRQIIC